MKIEFIDGVLLKKALSGAARLLEQNKEEVNSLNVFPVPDGDTGTNMLLTVKSALKQGLNVDENDTYKIALATSQGSLMGARGNSGVILSQLFRGFANGLKSKNNIDIITLANALKQASDTAYKAVMKPTEGTILTVAKECGEFAISISKEEKDIENFIKRVIEHGNKALDKTPEMLPVLKQAGVVDAGGKGLMYLFLGAYNAIIGLEEYFEEEEAVEIKKETVHQEREHIDTDDIKFGYCTEFMINTNYDDIEKFRKELSIQGDSLLVVGGDGIIKVHIHTNNPGVVIEKALTLGELKDIKIDNMRIQHREILLKDELADLKKESEKVKINKKYSFVAVSIGEGIDEVFRGLNVDAIVPGGQTMNPSTEDILKAIEDTTGESVIILPNNGNVILAAEQTKVISTRNIFVLPTKNIPQGIAALISFNEEASIEENMINMSEAINTVLTGQVTYAVRDTEYKDNKINKDDIIGLTDGEIEVTGKDINDVSLKLIEKMVDHDIGIITIFYGNDVDENKVNELSNLLEERFKDIDVEVVFGGQPLYYYIFSIE
ncbi:DAK2 domain-containing protein [Paratissierella segnis]|uniref:DAK2 domain-containing protein n=1 Tax=Paratissierella segnis TaxID=2763679 RepID=A0A926EY35_9FIRM|nr:DAK2 domain-containing protein [Paratissierella segnis]MBC8588622.1 DAK2 domain-containing protein [Paratissierella segnis]